MQRYGGSSSSAFDAFIYADPLRNSLMGVKRGFAGQDLLSMQDFSKEDILKVLSIAKNRTAAPAATWEDEERITFATDTSWRSEVDTFFEAIESDSPVPLGNSADALKLMKMVDRIYLNQ